MKIFRRSGSGSSTKNNNADVDICKNNSLPDTCFNILPDTSGEELVVQKTLSADDASMMMLKEDDSQPEICKNNSSQTDSEMTMSNGPSDSGEEIVQLPSEVSDEFASDDEGDDGQQDLIEAKPASITVEEIRSGEFHDTEAELLTEATDNTPAQDIEKCARMYQGLEGMMLNRVSTINQIRGMLRDEIKRDNGEYKSNYLPNHY